MKIGIVSDTHGLLRPEVIKALEGCVTGKRTFLKI